MAKPILIIYLDKKMFDDLHYIMDMSIQSENDKLILYKLYEGVTKQGWYREVMRAGIKAKKFEFEQKKKELEDSL